MDATLNAQSPLVTIIVLNWNRYDSTSRCLKSLGGATFLRKHIIVVDNGSSDGSHARLVEEFPNVEHIRNEVNLGFSRGCNVGIRAALLNPSCSYVLLINNDCLVDPDFLQSGVRCMEADQTVGLVGGKILLSPEDRRFWYAGGNIDLWRGRNQARGHGQIDRGQYNDPQPTGFVTGALMLIRRAVLEHVGLLPEEYFFGVEEWDYSMRVQQSGWTLFYVPTFLAYHSGDGSHWNYDPKFVYNYYRNKLIFQEKYLPRGVFPIWKLAFKLYARFLATRARKMLVAQHFDDVGGPVPYKELEYALRRALADHNQNELSEETLAAFELDLRLWKAGIDASL